MATTNERAEEPLGQDLLKFEAAVDRFVKILLTLNQRAAIVSFVYNVGLEHF